MPNARILIGPGGTNTRGPAWSSAQHAAEEYFVGRVMGGAWYPRPPIERWRPAEREAFLRELRRLEDERERQRVEASEQIERRSDEQWGR